MARHDVDVDLAPATDLATRGYYMERDGRAFAAAPAAVGAYAERGRRCCARCGSLRWSSTGSGHGQASDTHDRPATTLPLSTLLKRDLLPFADLVRTGVPAVMVGHLNVPGLTEQGVPATLSRTRAVTRASGPALTGCS